MQSDPNASPSAEPQRENEPIGLGAAAKKILEPEILPPEPDVGSSAPPPPPFSCAPLARMMIGLIFARLACKDPVWELSTIERDELGNAWGAAFDTIIRAPGPWAQAALATGIVLTPRVAELAVKKAKARRDAKAGANVDPSRSAREQWHGQEPLDEALDRPA